MTPTVLIAGIGNIFCGDDAFGVSVIWKLMRESDLPPNVRVKDVGIRGFDLVLELLGNPDLTIFADAMPRGEKPGTLYAIEADLDSIADLRDSGEVQNGHSLDPLRVLAMARGLGARLGRVIVVGCEPETVRDDTGHIGLSPAAEAAVDPAIEMIRSLISEQMIDWTDVHVRAGRSS